MDDAPSWAGQGWKDPCLSSSPEILNSGWSAQNSQGACAMVGAASPEDGKSLLRSLEDSTGVSKCAKSRQELLAENEGWPICPKLTGDWTHGGGQHPLKTAGPYLKPPWSSAAQSKCAKSCQELLAENEVWPICPKLTRNLPHSRDCFPWRWQVPTTIPQGAVQVWVNVPNHIWSCWPGMMHRPWKGKAGRTLVSALPLKNWTQADLPKTHKGPSPWWGLPPLKTASPYHHILRSSTGASKCAKLRLELPAVHHPHESGGAGLLSPLKLTGD